MEQYPIKDGPNAEEEAYTAAADAILNANRVVAVTGAGVSVESGIPDFRSDKTGLWSHVDPFEVASLWGFYNHSEAFYHWIRPILKKMAVDKDRTISYCLVEIVRLYKNYLDEEAKQPKATKKA